MKEKRPKNNYRLILQEEGTFAEKWALRVKPGQLRLLAVAAALCIAATTYILVALTPAREWLVPGYVDTETRRMQAEAWQKADSLSKELDTQSRYLQNMIAVIEGRVPEYAPSDSSGTTDPTLLENGPNDNPSLDALRDRIEEEDAFALGNARSLSEAGIWMAPVDGRVSDGWNPSIGHWGVDLVAPANSPVKAAGPGTVVFSGFTAGGGHTVMIQHEENRLSVYMHNSRNESKTGDRVKAGDVIAIIGNSGDHSMGPHLHFEWWEAGKPIDPTLRVSLQN